VSYLVDTDVLSLLERKRVPAKLASWIREHEEEIFLSVVSLAELQFGLERAPESHKSSLASWLSGVRPKLAPATEDLNEPVLVRWKELLARLKAQKRTMTCEDSLIAATALFHGHTIATRNTRHFEPACVPVFDPAAAVSRYLPTERSCL
jgi:toxin FitB